MYVNFLLEETGVLPPYTLPSGKLQSLQNTQETEFIVLLNSTGAHQLDATLQ